MVIRLEEVSKPHPQYATRTVEHAIVTIDDAGRPDLGAFQHCPDNNLRPDARRITHADGDRPGRI
ncbi:hypothetical protein NBRC116584_32110 [Hydrogenophaga sp. 5NK40-0174]